MEIEKFQILLSELKAGVARIDERTKAMQKHQGEIADQILREEQHTEAEFKNVHDRITKVEKKQAWFLGIIAAGLFFITTFGDKIMLLFG